MNFREILRSKKAFKATARIENNTSKRKEPFFLLLTGFFFPFLTLALFATLLFIIGFK